MALVTDYDCWHPDHDAVTVAEIVQNLKKNAENAQKLFRAAVRALPIERTCACRNALQHAIMTDLSKVPPDTRARLELLLKRYL
jgi:5'-methylthioadenosine phosphorylase